MIRKTFYLIIFLLLPFHVTAQDSLTLGEFTVKKVIDGDTFKFEGLDKSTRLLGLDTEETFKNDDAEMIINDISSYWPEYYASKKDSSGKPAKIESPFGYKTMLWTKELFKDVVKVRIEFDDDTRVIDMFGRYLVYIIAIREDGTEFNYNIECIKQGYSPYFSKYGYVKRFDKEFRKAQEYALKNKLGIWSGKELSYPDYDERLSWWDERAEQIKKFENEKAGISGYYSMLDINDFRELKKHVNDSVTVFGTISTVLREKNPNIAKFVIDDYNQLELVFFEKSFHIIDDLKLDNPKDYYIYVSGKLTEYNGQPQIIIDDSSQIRSK
jgi:endonuclease YncB( thermonuclease family)